MKSWWPGCCCGINAIPAASAVCRIVTNEAGETQMKLSSKSPRFVKSEGAQWEDLGNGIRRLILGYDPGLMMVRVEFKSGSVGEAHTHPHRQVTYVESGSFEVRVDDRKETLKKGDSFMAEPGVLHGVVALEDGCLIDVFNPAREDFLKTAYR
jgi:unsaturated pyranuronate lyase